MVKTITTTFSEDELTSIIEVAFNKFLCNIPKVATLEIIDRKELCTRLAITVPTVIRWEKKGKIPCFSIGSSVRYNWHHVISVLEAKTKGGVHQHG